MKQVSAGWSRHRENREFGHQFFQTEKTQGMSGTTQGKFDNLGNFLNFPKI